ncbi:hypothetical protein BV22DRAFT_1135370 [Leucogyrophana mollusca]|uniref:Uncharacterized protein n=1 Tax=Leucogyrophana mollusca TaxID=85980 RepID=A0ACB8AWB7_9AGAM|nr:hypothetical protein BV22DRAFT_1135370 [Leucogyrophana mollusca]
MTDSQPSLNSIFTKLGGGRAHKALQAARDVTDALTRSPDRMPLTPAHRAMVSATSRGPNPYYLPLDSYNRRSRGSSPAAAAQETPTRDSNHHPEENSNNSAASAGEMPSLAPEDPPDCNLRSPEEQTPRSNDLPNTDAQNTSLPSIIQQLSAAVAYPHSADTQMVYPASPTTSSTGQDLINIDAPHPRPIENQLQSATHQSSIEMDVDASHASQQATPTTAYAYGPTHPSLYPTSNPNVGAVNSPESQQPPHTPTLAHPVGGMDMDDDTMPSQLIATPCGPSSEERAASMEFELSRPLPTTPNHHRAEHGGRSHSSSPQSTSTPAGGGFAPPLVNIEAMVRQTLASCLVEFQPVILEAIQTSVAQSMAAIPGATPPKPPKASSSSALPDSDDTSDEDEDPLPALSRKRKKVSPRGASNFWHSAFRQYLREKKVIGGPKESFPPSAASPSAVRLFEQNNTGGPDLAAMQLDWGDFLTSRWNTEAISLLCLDFERQIKDGGFPAVRYDPKTTSIKQLREYLVRALKRPRQAFKLHVALEAMVEKESKTAAAKEVEEKSNRLTVKDRRYHRKRGTYQRRKRIVKENRHKDPQVWDRVDAILTRLDVDGMSGDETDSPPQGPKKVRRMALFWRSDELSELFDAVESYSETFRAECMKVAVGNQRFTREFVSRNFDTTDPVPGLPRNWYNDQWVQSLSSGTQKIFGLTDKNKGVTIPVMSRNVFPTSSAPA